MWEVRVFTGANQRGQPTQLSRMIHGGKRDAQRLAAELQVGAGKATPAGRSISDVLDAWVKQSLDTWAPSSARDQQSRVKTIKKDQIAVFPLARLTVGDVERWHTRMRKNGMQDAGVKNLHGVLRAALSQAVRWGWASSNVAALARLRSTKTQQRGVMSVDEVKAVMAAAATIDPAAELAFRIAAVAGTCRAELASLKWTDEKDGQLLIDSAIEIVKRNVDTSQVREAATKTANTRSVTLDDDTLELLAKLRAERSPYGPWMFGLGPDVVRPDHIGWWWRRSRTISGIDEKWAARPSTLVTHRRDRPGSRCSDGRRPTRPRQPRMTLRVYAHAFAAADQAVALGLGNILRGDGK